MKFWHRMQAWYFEQRARRERRKLLRFIRQSAREICAWKQDIADLEEDAVHHLELAGLHPPAAHEETGKVVRLEPKAA